MKSILYYLDPRTELNDKFFRYATLRSYLLPEIEGIKETDSSIDIKIILSRSIFNKAVDNNLNLDCVDCLVINEELLDDTSKIDSLNIGVDLYHNELNSASSSALIKVIESFLPNDFKPDIIISYESPVPFFKEIYPSALILNSMFGFFSRAPFPAYSMLDPCGLYEYSYQYKHAEKIRSEKINDAEKNVVNQLRNQSCQALAKYHPLKKYISSLYERFDHLVVLACQIDNYFSYNGCTTYKNQYEMVKDVLSQTPEQVGILVTEHGYERQFSDEQVVSLTEQHGNFIYFNEKNIPTPTQFLLPYVDGALSVSSSIGYQAALWQIPYLGLGKSQIDVTATAINLPDFYQAVLSGNKYDRDNIIYYLLSRVHFSHKNDIANGEAYLAKLNELLCVFKSGNDDFEYFSSKKNAEEVMADVVSGNREWLLKKNITDSCVPEVDHLRVAMSNSMAISFDLFDTLVERDFVEPHELFKLIEVRVRNVLKNKNLPFHFIRRQAEIDLRRESRGEFEITLDEIYERFNKYFYFSVSELNCMKDIEIQAEIELVHPKKEMVREYYFSKLMCRSVSIITDIYLPEYVIERILAKTGIRGWDALLVSAETKTRKNNGTIYPEYLEFLNSKFNIIPSSALHVGDNAMADGDMAKKHGLKSYVFPKAIENYKKSMIGNVFRSSLNNSDVSSSIVNGLFANKFNAGHWNKVNKMSIFNADEYNYGYMAIGPLVAGFTKWLYRRVRKLGLSNIYFLSRDGWILKQAFDVFYPYAESGLKTEYLYSSRRAAMVASLKNVEDIIEVATQNFNARKLSDFLYSRFGLEMDAIDKSILDKYKYKPNSMVSPYYEFGKLTLFLKDIQSLILSNAKVERDSYIEYLRETGFENDCRDGKAAVVDIGYSGSMQYYLKKMLECDNMHGFYFLTHHHSRDYFIKDHFEGFLQDLDDHKIAYRHGLNDHVFIFEAALSSPEGSLVKMIGSGENRKMVFLDSQEEHCRKKSLARMHYGTMDFVMNIKYRFGSYFSFIDFSPIFSSYLILNFAQNPNGRDAEMFASHEVENVFGGGSVCLISPFLDSFKNHNGKIDPKLVDELLKSSKWKPGASAYYKYVAEINSDGSVPTSISHDSTLVTSRIDILKKVKLRKFAKLLRNPHSFFNDSKIPFIRVFRIFFKERENIFFKRS